MVVIPMCSAQIGNTRKGSPVAVAMSAILVHALAMHIDLDRAPTRLHAIEDVFQKSKLPSSTPLRRVPERDAVDRRPIPSKSMRPPRRAIGAVLVLSNPSTCSWIGAIDPFECHASKARAESACARRRLLADESQHGEIAVPSASGNCGTRTR